MNMRSRKLTDEIMQLCNDFNMVEDSIISYRRDFIAQRYRTLSRGCDKNGDTIEFKLSFREWLTIWINSGHLSKRGKHRDEYCMARNNDIGNYAVGNVSIVLQHKNNSDAHLGLKHTNIEKKRRAIAYTGPTNPNARPVSVYGVVYSTLKQAMLDTGLTDYKIRKMQNAKT